jgi:adenosylmethionine-8-amino-7-oxononanoate aminotransferase
MRLPPGLTREDVVALERAHVWPPYTPSERHERVDPFVIVGGEGAWVEDANGERYLDGNASWWTMTLGHGHPRLRRALIAQAEELMHVAAAGITNAASALLARELSAVAPGMARAHFSDDGSTAVEAAIKIAFQYWAQNGHPERNRFVAFASSYHGDTIGAASLAANKSFHGVFAPLFFDVIHVGAGGWDHAIEELERAIETRTIAAVVVEPLVQGAAGMRMCPPEILARVREIANDTLLIADEVFTGYGRTGAFWACERANVTPDLICTAKGFTAGVLPMAATLASARVYDGFRGGTDRALMHGHTFSGNPLGAAVAREVLAIMRDERVVEGVAERAAMITRAFDDIATIPGVLCTRTLGAIGAADLGEGGYRGQRGWRVFEEARRRGAILRPLGDTVYITPPLNIPLADLSTLLTILGDSIRAAR